MSRILAIDPGPTESALVLYDVEGRWPLRFDKQPNDDVLMHLGSGSWSAGRLAVEMIASYGMPVGAEVFETCVWIGRFIEGWQRIDEPPFSYVYRRDVKLHICGNSRAKDANIRQALIDRYGGKEKAIGKKANPGPLHGLSGDCWSALAVAITAAEYESAEVAA